MYSDIGKAMMKNAAAAGMSNELNTIFESDAIPQIPESISSASNLQEAFGVSGLRTQPSTSSLTSGVTAVSQGRQLTEEQQDNLKVRVTIKLLIANPQPLRKCFRPQWKSRGPDHLHLLHYDVTIH